MPISDTGVIITPSATAIAEAQQILIDTYGVNVNLAFSSPNGQLVQNIALAITQRENDQADTVNSMNPNIATGLQLDAICANLDITRTPATKSTATCTFTGLSGVTIPISTQIQSVNGDIFLTDTILIIGGGGSVSGSVTAQVGGPIQVTANTINKIITGISGWDTVNNPMDGIVGVVQESDTELRERRTSQLAFASAGSLISIQAGALIYNPTSVFVTDNITNTDVVRDGITITAKSLLLVLQGGGTDTQIANMLLQRLAGGIGMSGTHSFSVIIPNSSETFVANWQIANPQTLGLNVNLKVGFPYSPTVAQDITNIINNNFSFDVIGKYIDATEFIYLLIKNNISPIVSLTFNVGSNMNLIQYTMPISDSLGTSLSVGNVTVNYV